MVKTCVKSKLYNYLDEMQSPRVFSGWELQTEMFNVTGKHTYPSTLLDYAREYADKTGSNLTCLDKNKSIYKFERFIKYGNAIK